MTLGTSAAVNSCSAPCATTICRFLALSSRRKFPAHRIVPPYYLLVHTEHLPQPRLQDHVRRTLAASLQPVFKILNFDDMRDLGIADLHGDRCQSASDLTDPVLPAHGGEGLGDSFVERLRRHVERMRGVVQIVDNDGAGFKSHDGNLSYSPFIRLWDTVLSHGPLKLKGQKPQPGGVGVGYSGHHSHGAHHCRSFLREGL